MGQKLFLFYITREAGQGSPIVTSLKKNPLFTWEQIEKMVCGLPEINAELLESLAEYSGCRASDEHVKFFWQVLKEFNDEERSALVKFTWG